MPLTPEFFSDLTASDDYVVQLHDRLWLMDNHKWACWVWELHRDASPGEQKAALLHLDYHFDSVNDFANDPDATRVLQSENLAELRERIRIEDRIGYDSFIAPALIRGVIGDVHFFCRQEDDWDHGLDAETLAIAQSEQIFYDSVEAAAAAHLRRPYIFDLCLDLFNNEGQVMYQGDIWPEPEILRALDSWKHIIQEAACITVSLSFDYSGTAEQTRYLAQLVLTEMLSMLAEPPTSLPC